MTTGPAMCAILAVDAESSSSVPGADQPWFRERIQEALIDSLDTSGLSWDSALVHDFAGDGWMLLFDPDHLSALIGAFVDDLADHLTNRNRRLSPDLRMRVAIHRGLVHLPTDGQPRLGGGAAVTDVNRLLDGEPLRRILADSRVPVALIVSDEVYREHVAGHYTRLDPARFAEVTARVKEFDRPAWVYVPHYSAPPLTRDGTDQAARPETTSPTGPGTGGNMIVNSGPGQMGVMTGGSNQDAFHFTQGQDRR